MFGEWERPGLTADNARQVRLGRLLGVDYFVWATRDSTAGDVLVEIVNAANGQVVFAERLTWDSSEAAGFDEIGQRMGMYTHETTSRAVMNVPFFHNNFRKLTSSPGINLTGLTAAAGYPALFTKKL